MQRFTFNLPAWQGIIALIVFFSIKSCHTASDSGETISPKTGHWRGVLDLQGQPAPFRMEIQEKGTDYVAYLINGAERLELDEIQLEGDSIHINLLAFGAELKAQLEPSGESMQGIWVKHGTSQPYEVSFKAELGQDYRFEPPQEAAEVDLSGKWSVTFREDDGQTYPAIGVFEQDGKQLKGTFLTTTGDYRYLNGVVEGKKMKLSTFDGGHGFLFLAQNEGDSLQGEFWSGPYSYETFQAYRNDTATLPAADQITYLKKGYDRLSFSFPNLAGEPISLNDPKYQGKVVIVQILGSWCPNCMDEIKFLVPYYEENKDRGFEIIGLAYERSPDFEKAQPRVLKMKERFNIPYDLLIAGVNDKAQAAQTLPMLNHIWAFPTMILIDREGEVRWIHTGFSGAGTGSYYEEFKEEFYQRMDKLFAEKV